MRRLAFFIFLAFIIFYLSPVFADTFLLTINYDPNFLVNSLSAENGAAPADWTYWAPARINGCGQGDSSTSIKDGALHTHMSSRNSKGWNCSGSAVARVGHFPWMNASSLASTCQDQKLVPDWNCPYGTHGFREPAHTDFQLNASWDVTFLSRAEPANLTSGIGEYRIKAASFYFWFTKGTALSLKHTYLEVQIRVAQTKWNTTCLCWINSPIGNETAWDSNYSYGYSLVVEQLYPGQRTVVSDYDLDALYRKAMAKWNLSTDIHAVLVGIEAGSEGYGATIDVDYSKVSVTELEPEQARADTNFDHLINDLDTSLNSTLYGTCPESDWGVYQWIADVDSYKDGTDISGDSHCIDSADSLLFSLYTGKGYNGTLSGQTTCVEDWSCDWSPCENGSQNRVCIDLNDCGTTGNKPADISQTCIIVAPTENVTSNVTPAERPPGFQFPSISVSDIINQYWYVFLIIAGIVVAFAVVKIARKIRGTGLERLKRELEEK